MANNPYVNKVVFGSATLVDLTGTTATADKILTGYGAFGADGAWMDGTATSSGGYVTQDQDGYIILPSTGGGSSITVESLSVTQNGTYTAPTGKAYSPVTVTVSGSPSATQHTIYFEFADSTDATINAWYDSSFISDAIRATEPTTYGQKTVDTASLDGVAWYTRPTTQWETVYDDSVRPNADTPYNYVWISALSNVYPVEGEEWRVTVAGTVYYTTATQQTAMDTTTVVIGNPKYSGGQDDGSSIPLNLYNLNYGALMGDTELSANVDYTLKLERKVTV